MTFGQIIMRKKRLFFCAKIKLKVAVVVNQDTINQSTFNELIYGVPIRGYGATNGSKLDLAFINRFYRCFLRGVYMSIMLISEASHNGVTLSENIVEGFEHWGNCAYTGMFYFKAGL